MAMCSVCGSIFSIEDAEKHVCDEKAVPAAGTEVTKDGRVIDVETHEEKVA